MITDIRKLIAARRDEENDEGGFTLIELLIVVVVLGILAAIVVFAVQNLTGESAQTACRADARTVETAQEAYKAANTNYAASMADLVPEFIRSEPDGGTRYQLTTSNASGVEGRVMVTTPTVTTPTDFRAASDPCSTAS